MTNILLTTFGISWQIIPEIIGFTNPETINLYKNHKDILEIEEKRKKHNIKNINEIWMVGTGGQKTLNSLKTIVEWYDKLSKNKPGLKIWLVKNADDLTSEYEFRQMAETIHRITLLAYEKTKDKSLFLSLTGGRKTMSSDLQNSASFFGCKAMIHILDNFEIAKSLKDKNTDFFLSPLVKPFSNAFTPVITGQYQKNILLEIDPIIKSKDFFIKYPENSDPVFVEFDDKNYLIDEIEKRKKNATNLVFNYSSKLIQGENQTNFLALYTLPPELIGFLKNYKIGINKKNLKKDYNLLKKLPKTELHCHLGGVADAFELIEIAKELETELLFYKKVLDSFFEKAKKLIKSKEIVKLRKTYIPKKIRTALNNIPEPFITANFILLFKDHPELLEDFIYSDLKYESNFCGKGFSPYEKIGDLQGSGLLQHEKTLQKTCEILKRKANFHNIKYLELRCSPHNYTRGGMSPLLVYKTIENELNKLKNIEAGIIFIGSRHGKMSTIYSHVELAKSIAETDENTILKGFDLAGNEKAKKPSEIREAFLPLMEKCMHFTIHAGENMPAENIWEAVYHLSAERIGHGLTLKDNSSLMEKFLNSGTALEMCPSSNFQIVGYRDFLMDETKNHSDYPLKFYLDKGLKVTINTDNPGISKTDFTNEFLKAAKMTENGLSLWEIFILIRNGFKSAFADRQTKTKLIKNAENEILDLILKGDFNE
ncbi:MAG: CRISPR-associated ring nuclease [Desulforegulaceae bacterium]|nr:CRISPR-associated ring nuclease [Desulforegulaceae bacterium]